jgi:hypothetical protein
MYLRPTGTQTLSPSNVELEEKKDEEHSKKKVRFKLKKSNLLFCFVNSHDN